MPQVNIEYRPIGVLRCERPQVEQDRSSWVNFKA